MNVSEKKSKNQAENFFKDNLGKHFWLTDDDFIYETCVLTIKEGLIGVKTYRIWYLGTGYALRDYKCSYFRCPDTDFLYVPKESLSAANPFNTETLNKIKANYIPGRDNLRFDGKTKL